MWPRAAGDNAVASHRDAGRELRPGKVIPGSSKATSEVWAPATGSRRTTMCFARTQQTDFGTDDGVGPTRGFSFIDLHFSRPILAVNDKGKQRTKQ